MLKPVVAFSFFLITYHLQAQDDLPSSVWISNHDKYRKNLRYSIHIQQQGEYHMG